MIDNIGTVLAFVELTVYENSRYETIFDISNHEKFNKGGG